MLVVASNLVAVCEMPNSLCVGLVVGKGAFIVGSIGEDPASNYDLIIRPRADEFGSCLIVGVGPVAMLLAEHPPSSIDIFIRIDICALSMLDSVCPLT